MHRTLDGRVQINLKMTPTIIDPSLQCQFEDEQLVGTNGSYVDDLFRTGTNESQAHSDDTLERFEITRNQQALFTFAGMHITEPESMYHTDQDFYMSKIEQILSDDEFSRFASMRMRLPWLANIRRKTLFQIS